jgi:hypothetical protein
VCARVPQAESLDVFDVVGEEDGGDTTTQLLVRLVQHLGKRLDYQIISCASILLLFTVTPNFKSN